MKRIGFLSLYAPVVCLVLSVAPCRGQSVQLANLPRPPMSPNMIVGDYFTVTVTGGADQDVVVQSEHNGVWSDPFLYGQTLDDGTWSVSGQQTIDSAGSWVENWYVGGAYAGTLTLNVSAEFTVLVNGSFDEYPDWENPGSPEFQAISATFGTDPTGFHWGGDDVVYPAYSSIYNGAQNLADFINGHQFVTGEKLNIVAHSHGGNVAKIAAYGLNHQVDNLIQLGTPVNWDLPADPYWNIANNCLISSFEDYVQFSGASAYQLAAFGYDQDAAAEWTYQEGVDLSNDDWEDAEYDAEQIAWYEADAAYWWLTAKQDGYALTVMLGSESHDDLHEPPVWNGDVVGNCGIPN